MGGVVHPMDYRYVQRKKIVELIRGELIAIILIDFLFENIPIITAEKRTVEPK